MDHPVRGPASTTATRDPSSPGSGGRCRLGDGTWRSRRLKVRRAPSSPVRFNAVSHQQTRREHQWQRISESSTRDFIRVNGEGQLDLEMSKKLLAEVAAVAVTTTDYEILLDTRQAQSRMSVVDLWYLATDVAAKLVSARDHFPKKTAVLCPLKEFDHVSFFALCAQNRGLQVMAFTSFEDAIEWLIANGT